MLRWCIRARFLPLFRDDQSYPFKPPAWYSIWGPLPAAPDCFVYLKPGFTPRLLICAPDDFWYEQVRAPPRATGLRVSKYSSFRASRRARAALPQDLSRVALLGECGAAFDHWGLGLQNPAKLLLALDFTRAIKTPYELGAAAAGQSQRGSVVTAPQRRPSARVRANMSSTRRLSVQPDFASRNSPTTRSLPSMRRAACCIIKICAANLLQRTTLC